MFCHTQKYNSDRTQANLSFSSLQTELKSDVQYSHKS